MCGVLSLTHTHMQTHLQDSFVSQSQADSEDVVASWQTQASSPLWLAAPLTASLRTACYNTINKQYFLTQVSLD